MPDTIKEITYTTIGEDLRVWFLHWRVNTQFGAMGPAVFEWTPNLKEFAHIHWELLWLVSWIVLFIGVTDERCF